MFELKFNLKGTINRKEFLLSMILSIINFIVCLAISMIDLFIHFGGDYKTGTTPSLSFGRNHSVYNYSYDSHNIMVFSCTMYEKIA